jgi:small conductance mechanosensitive channel
VGLAAQDSLANLVAGLTILWDRPFHIGDNVTIAGTYGQVRQIGLRTTRLLTVDQVDAILPNKMVINEKILNHTLTPHLRVNVPVGIGYAADIGAARQALLAAVDGHPQLAQDPAPKVVVKELGDSAVQLELRAWLRDPHKEREVFYELLELAKVTLDQAGIEIPFPQRTLHLADPGGLERLTERPSPPAALSQEEADPAPPR